MHVIAGVGGVERGPRKFLHFAGRRPQLHQHPRRVRVSELQGIETHHPKIPPATSREANSKRIAYDEALMLCQMSSHP